MTKEELNELTGAELLRLVVQNIESCHGDFNDQYSLEDLIQIHRMFLLSGWDIYPDCWTNRQVKEALVGIPPQWSKNEKPKYYSNLEKKKIQREYLEKNLDRDIHLIKWMVDTGCKSSSEAKEKLFSWQESTGCKNPSEAGERIRELEVQIEELKDRLYCANHGDGPES